MYPETSVWLIIILAMISANLPFLTERMFAFSPFRLTGEPEKFIGFYLLRALVSYGLIGFVFYLLTEPAFPTSAKLFAVVVYIVLFTIPGFIYKGIVQHKHLGLHFIELIVFIVFIVSIGFFIESHYANRFSQSWQFYAIGICLFLVLAFPGFVWRHLMRHANTKKILE
ncbi:DUF2818 family protein [Pelistega ratti]|uniref:DUF2818 family protein n=1 Tax=Pelistega ratti TaxID=2652177 RepID=UPI001F24D136|nr:DUF2818 family protein [Pelistega ratti]